MSQSKNTTHVFGAIDIMNFADLNNTRMTGLAPPISGTDATNKSYVDSKVVASNLTGGVGITVNTANNTINSNPSQTQVVALGTIQTGTWTANTIQIPYGGTGQTSFSVNKLVFCNGANKLASTPELIYDSQTFNSTIPIHISNSQQTDNVMSSTGGLIVSGGVNIHKNLYIDGNCMLNSDMTVGSITVNGTIALNQIASNTSIFTNTSINNLQAVNIDLTGYLTSPLITTSNLVSINNTQTNLVLTTGTLGQSTFTNITTGGLNANGISVFNTTFSTNVSTGTLVVSSLTSSANLIATHISTATLRVTTLSSTANGVITTQTSSNINVLVSVNTQLTNSVNLNSTNGNVTNITNTNLISTNSTIANMFHTNLNSSVATIASLLSTTISTNNLQVTNSTLTNLVSTNITASNIVNTVSSVGALRVSGNTNLFNLNATSTTTSNILVTNNLTANLTNIIIATIGNVNVTSNLNSANTSTGNLYSNISINVSSSIGSLNVSGDITNTGGTIYTSIVTSSNLNASNLTRSLNINTTNLTATNLRSTGVSIQATTFSSNLSTGTINVSSTINVPHVNNTNSTTTNIVNTNILNTNLTSSSAKITLSSIGNNYVVNSSVANTFTVNANITTNTTSTLLNTRIYRLQSNYQGSVIGSAGSFFNILPSTFNNNSTPEDGSVNAWYANYIGPSTLAATNLNVTTNKATNLYIKSNVTLGANQNINFNSSMLLGYVSNTTGGNLNTQLSFERADGNPYAGLYTESTTNRFIMINSSLAGGSGIGIYTITDTPVIFSNVPSSTNITPTDYIQLLNSTSTFYSTVDSTSTTTGALVLNGGLGVSKNITAQKINALSFELSGDSTTGNLHVDGNVTITDGALTQPGYGLFTLTTTNFPTGESDIEFNTSASLSSGVSVTIHPFTISASIVMENVVTFLYSGIYSVHLQLNSNTSTTSATLIQTHINKFDGTQWQKQQTSSLNSVLESSSDIHGHFMIQAQANEHWKFTLDNGHNTNFVFNSDSKKSRLMINKIG